MNDSDHEDQGHVERIDFGGAEVYVLSMPLEPELPESLSPSERDVIKLALKGVSNAEIAEARGSALQTVANQLRSAYEKIGVNSRGELASVLFGDTENR
jgi:DNA-binding CsgD family transcriptional regulator